MPQQAKRPIEILLTVIIPVYRVSNTIDRCVRSVVRQEYDKMEIILVDDGSPDDCPAKCDKWCSNDDRIRVIHKTNGGLSDARNAGIAKASGKYITFIDSDDYIAEDTISELMNILLKHGDCDILEYPIFREFGSDKQNLLRFEDRTYHDMTDYWIGNETYAHSYACNKVFRKKLFDNVRFPVGIAFEDVHTLPMLLTGTRTVMTTTKGLYYYCSNSNSITSKAGGNEWRNLLDAHIKIMDSYMQHPLFYKYYMHVVNIQVYEYELTGDTPRLKRFRVTRTKGLGYRAVLKMTAINIIGIKGLCKLNKVLNKIAKFH